ncbi:MAG: beta-propeller domain-containing protein [Actinomycetota bacterium]|nr:beta-propeller domain-containing protein [Actinomycetota bacterium]
MRTSHGTVLTGGIAALALTTTMVVSAVGPTGSVFAPTPAAAGTGLRAFDDCTELTAWYVEAALAEVSAYGLGGSGYGYLDDVFVSARTDTAATSEAATQDTGATPVGNAATGTNVQEAGVDEPDIAKTDGSRTYVVRGRTLVVTDVTQDEPAVVARLDLPRELYAAQILLVGDRLVLTASGHSYGRGGPIVVDRVGPGYYSDSQHTYVGIVDVSDPAAPTLESERAVEGSNVSAREHDGTVRLVVSDAPGLSFVYPGRGTTGAEALRENRRIVRETSAQDWLPGQRIDGGDTEPLLDCSDVTRPQEQAGLGIISVLTFDPQTDDLDTLAVAAGGNLVYSSSDRMYVATSESDQWLMPLVLGMARDVVGGSSDDTGTANAMSTGIHAFDVSGDTTAYVSSGEVPGWTPDRWSFSEHEGRLRVASMLGDVWNPRESVVTVLEENGERLDTVGSVGGMGEDEQIQSVRWFDDLAVIVTFRQTDPLYTVDLSDPQQPQVLGELKIPGFSAYLHPIGGDLLLGVGQDASRLGQTQGSQVSSFDLSDLAHPTRLEALSLGTSRWSPVEDDARSFTYLPEDRIALVPVTGRGGSRLVAIRIGEDGLLHHAGSVEVPGWAGDTRALPLADGRVAIVARGAVLELVHPTALAD